MPNGKHIAFNSRTAALAEVEDDFLNILNNINKLDYNYLDKKNRILFDSMLKNGYIIEDSYNELNELKYRNSIGKFNQEKLTLIIAPTLNCNFKCIYCYETPDTSIMNESTQESIIKFVNNYISTIKEVSIVWYGGEPLLCQDIINNISSKLIALCNKNNVLYTSFIITNGYLINDNTVKFLLNNSIFGAQITLDGPRDIHNKRRLLKSNSENNFEKVVNSIKLLAQNNIAVSIRVNIDKTNLCYADDLLNFLKNNDMTNIFTYFAPVTDFTESCKSFSTTCYATHEYSEISIILQKKLVEKGFKSGFDSSLYPLLKYNYCGADQINNFVIDPNGFLYKCMSEIGTLSKSIGDVKKYNFQNNKEFNRLLTYMTSSPFELDSCSKCKFIPMCMGGCPLIRTTTNKSSCDRWKYNLKDTMQTIYNYTNEYPNEFKNILD